MPELEDWDEGLPGVSISEGDGLRYLHLGDTPWIQGAMRLRKPQHVELQYVQRMLAWLLWHEVVDAPTVAALRTVQLGLGAASLTKFCGKTLGSNNLAIEINAQVVAACRTWFALGPDEPRNQVWLCDAQDWLQAPQGKNQADALMVDLYDHEAAAPVLDGPSFYRLCHEALTEHGILSVNLFGRDHSFDASLKRIAAVFGPNRVWHFKPTVEGNAIVLASKSLPLPPQELLERRCVDLQNLFGFNTKSWLKALKPAL